MVRLGLQVLRHQVVVAHGNMVPEELTISDADLEHVHNVVLVKLFHWKLFPLFSSLFFGEGEGQEGEGRKSKVRPLEGAESTAII